MEQFRQIGEVLGSMKALIVLQDKNQINRRQCSLLFDIFNLAFDSLSEEIKHNLRLEEKNTKWKSLEHPLKELHRVFKEAEVYIRQSLDSKDWWVKALYLHNDQDAVEFHIHNLLCNYAIVLEAVEIAGEISGLDLDDMAKKRIVMSNKYNSTWNDPKLFMWKYGKQHLISEDILCRMRNAWKEDCWVLFEEIKGKKDSSFSSLNKQELRLCNLLMKKLNGEESLCHSSVLTGAKDYQVRRRLGGGTQYKEMQWLGETFVLRHFYGESSVLNSEIFQLFALSHPSIVQYICGFHDEEKKEYFIVMEMMGKDLNSYIKEVCGSKRRIPFALPSAVDIMLQIARGMEYLHSKKIYHGDLNPSNVFVRPRNSSSEGYFHAKISGFGLKDVKTTPSRTSSPNKNEALPFIWHAPEVLTEQEKPGSSGKHKYSEKADVYSFGMLCFELLTGKVPFEDLHLQGDKMSRNIKAGERPLFPFALPKFLANLTRKCWQTDPNQRPSFSSICRILRYVKRLIVMNPHLAEPEIPSTIQVDVCDIEATFMNKFPFEAGITATSVSHIPFQLFSYRLFEKEKLTRSNSEKNWETRSEEVLPLHNKDEMINTLEGSFGSFSSTTHETMSDSEENPKQEVLVLRKSNSMEDSEKKAPLLKKYNTLPASKIADATRMARNEIPANKGSEKKVSNIRKCNSVRMSEDSGKSKGKIKGPSFCSSPVRSPASTAERRHSMPQKVKRLQADYLSDHSSC